MYCACWCDLDPIQGQGQGHGTFELPKIAKAVHAGGDDCQPPCRAFWFLGQWHQKMISNMCIFCPTMHYWGSTHIFVLIMLAFDSVLKQKRTWVCMILQNPGIFPNWETGSVAFMRWEVDGLPTSVRCSGISSSRGTLLWSSMVLFWKHSKIGTIL